MIKKFFSILGALIVLNLTGCGIIDFFYLPPPEDTAQELFDAGNQAMREHKYYTAVDYYTKIKDVFPFSPYAIEAELLLADALFEDGEFLAAADAYREFETLHPRHEAISYVLYKTGLALQRSFFSIDRPTTHVVEAIEFYERVLDGYFDSEYAPMAEDRIKECRRLLAEREIYIGNFYGRTGNHGAAWLRYKYVIENYADIEDLAIVAKEKLNIAYLKHRQEEAERNRTKREGSWRDYFNWL